MSKQFSFMMAVFSSLFAAPAIIKIFGRIFEGKISQEFSYLFLFYDKIINLAFSPLIEIVNWAIRCAGFNLELAAYVPYLIALSMIGSVLFCRQFLVMWPPLFYEQMSRANGMDVQYMRERTIWIVYILVGATGVLTTLVGWGLIELVAVFFAMVGINVWKLTEKKRNKIQMILGWTDARITLIEIEATRLRRELGWSTTFAVIAFYFVNEVLENFYK